MNTKEINLIWEERDGAPCAKPVCYATTTFEARRECVSLARKFSNLLDESERPLYFGETPTKPGLTMVYTYPGPNESSISIYDVVEYKKWFGAPVLNLGECKYRVYIEKLGRAKTTLEKETKLNTTPEISHRYENTRAVRGNASIHDRILNEIEAAAGKFAKSETSTIPPAPALPPKEWENMLNELLREYCCE